LVTIHFDLAACERVRFRNMPGAVHAGKHRRRLTVPRDTAGAPLQRKPIFAACANPTWRQALLILACD
jgi:hypothetical protein